jgi:dTDP-4-amino-4,6-dideoxygalactose transaminase
VVASGHLAEGPEVAALERELGAQEGLAHACALAHGTGGLHLSLLALGVGPGHKVLIPSYACVSLLNPVAYVGAQPVLVDSCPGLPDMDLEQALELASQDPSIRAAIVPHLFGRHLAVDALAERLAVIEDSTHSLGHPAPLRGELRVASFFATKLIAGGEGGVVLTRRADLAACVRDLHSYDEREQWIPRYNYKMTDVSAAILRVQLARLPGFLARRQHIARFYQQHLPHALPAQPDQVYYRFLLLLPGPVDPLMNRLQEAGISSRRPVFRTLHRYLGLPDAQYPHAQSFWERALSLPLHPELTSEQAQRVVEEVQRCWQG